MLSVSIYLGVTSLFASLQQANLPDCYMGEFHAPNCNDNNFWNGYWWQDKVWVPGYPSIESWYTPSPIWFYANAVFYGQNVMEGTARYRDLDLTGYVDGVALLSPSDIGLPVWLKRPGYAWEGPFLVVDSAMRGDFYPLAVYMDEAVEVGYVTAHSWGMVNGSSVKLWRIEDVQVSKVNPEILENFVKVDYEDWFVENYTSEADFDFGTPLYRSPSTWRIDGEWVTFESPNIIYCVLTRC